MNKSITQDIQNEKQVSESIKRFFHRFHVSSALKQSNAYKKKGIGSVLIFVSMTFILIPEAGCGQSPQSLVNTGNSFF